MILAIDPGPTESAWVLLYGNAVLAWAKEPNERVLAMLQNDNIKAVRHPLVIEEIASYGMPVGREVFQTVRLAGRFEQVFAGGPVHYLPRLAVKLYLCHSARAKDGNVRQALIDRWGGKMAALGTKKAPGPLYGISGDGWAALAVAVTFTATQTETSV